MSSIRNLAQKKILQFKRTDSNTSLGKQFSKQQSQSQFAPNTPTQSVIQSSNNIGYTPSHLSSVQINTQSSTANVNVKNDCQQNLSQFNLEEQRIYREFEMGNEEDQVEILVYLSQKMKKSKLYKMLLQKHCEKLPYFKKFTQKLTSENSLNFFKLLNIQSFEEKELIIEYGDIGKEMYYILEGEVGILIPKSQEELEKLHQEQQKQKELEAQQSSEDNIQPQIDSPLKSQQKLLKSQQKSMLKSKKDNLDPGQIEKRMDFQDYIKSKYQKFNLVKTFGNHYAFGEVALEHRMRRTASVLVKSKKCHLISISGEAYKEFIQKDQQKARDEQVQKLQSLPIFEDWKKEGISIAMDHTLEQKSYRVGDVIYQEGEPLNSLFILEEGEVQILYKVPQFQYSKEQNIPHLIEQNILEPQYLYMLNQDKQREEMYQLYYQIMETQRTQRCETEENEEDSRLQQINQMKAGNNKKQTKMARVANISPLQCFGEYELFQIFQEVHSVQQLREIVKYSQRVTRVVCTQNVKVKQINVNKYLNMQAIYGRHTKHRHFEELIKQKRDETLSNYLKLEKEFQERQELFNTKQNLKQQLDYQGIDKINSEELDCFIPQAIKLKIPQGNYRPITVSHQRNMSERQVKYTQEFKFQKLLSQQEQMAYKPSLQKPLKIFTVQNSNKVLQLLKQDCENQKQRQQQQEKSTQKNNPPPTQESVMKNKIPLAFPEKQFQKVFDMQHNGGAKQKSNTKLLSLHSLNKQKPQSPEGSKNLEQYYMTSQISNSELLEEIFSAKQPKSQLNLQLSNFSESPKNNNNNILIQQQQQNTAKSPRDQLQMFRHMERVKQNYEQMELKRELQKKKEQLEHKKQQVFSPISSPRNSTRQNSNVKKTHKFENGFPKQGSQKENEDIYQSPVFLKEMQRLMVGVGTDMMLKKKKIEALQLTNFQKYQQNKEKIKSIHSAKNSTSQNFFSSSQKTQQPSLHSITNLTTVNSPTLNSTHRKDVQSQAYFEDMNVNSKTKNQKNQNFKDLFQQQSQQIYQNEDNEEQMRRTYKFNSATSISNSNNVNRRNISIPQFEEQQKLMINSQKFELIKYSKNQIKSPNQQSRKIVFKSPKNTLRQSNQNQLAKSTQNL